MRNKKCLSFILIVVFLVSAMMCNVQALTPNWTCVRSNTSRYSVGDKVSRATDIGFYTNSINTYCEFESDIYVKEGDVVSLYFEAVMEPYSEYAASNCYGIVYAGETRIARCRSRLEGDRSGSNFTDTVTITKATEGKLTLEFIL